MSLRIVRAALLLLAIPSLSSATTIQYLATDLTDSVAGQDLWQYSYFVSGFNFETNFGFSTLFDPTLYEQLEDPPPAVSSDWDIITLQPDAQLPADGLYDALALAADATLALPFTVTLVWLGAPGTTPGTQPFDVNEFDASGTFVGVVESGMTVLIPEPSTAVLVGVGLLVLGLRRRPWEAGF